MVAPPEPEGLARHLSALPAEWVGLAADVWFEAKLFVERHIAFTNDALHVLAGTLLFIAIAALLRRGTGNWLPWLIVLALELANEWSDLRNDTTWPNRAEQYGEGAKDIVLTMLIPTVLLIVSRRRPALLARR